MNAKVVLVGMYVPPNYGLDYTQKFHAMYGTLAKELRLPLVPFLLAGLEDKPDQFQDDQNHPNQGAQPLATQRFVVNDQNADFIFHCS